MTRQRQRQLSSSTRRITSSVLGMSGDGIAQSYTWHEEAFELELSVEVPNETKAKDLQFHATSNFIDLRLLLPSGNNKKEERILLDKSRPLKGKVSVEGTFWVLSDPFVVPVGNDDAQDEEQKTKTTRTVTVTIEKQIRHAKDDFDVIEYDWKGVYAHEYDNEVSYRKYDEAEELNVREYAASLGVDIDNLNMSLVDKAMFTSGLTNMTKSSIDSLQEAGLMKEVTRQGDGSEWITNESGEREPFNSLLGGNNDNSNRSQMKSTTSIPFLDTNSPWHKAVPVAQKQDDTTSLHAKIPEDTLAVQAKMEMENKRKGAMKELQRKRAEQASDPIETLTVTRLRDILKSRGLKVSGNKKELQDRLRSEVNNMLSQESNDSDPTTTGAS